MFAQILAILLTTSYILLASPVYAQSAAPSAIQSTIYSLPTTVSPTSPLYTDLLVNNLFHSFSCIALGQSVIGQPCLTYQVTQNAQGVIQSVPMLSQVNTSGGALGTTTSLIGALYTHPPVRTADYLASVRQNFGIVKEANAQVVGSGAQVLNPILSLWQVSRNISYVIMIIIFLVIGLMVMFRNKINPQTVITAQAALPGLVIGLVMITFSFFFAGLISDMAFVGTNVVGYYFVAAEGKLSDSTFQDQLNLSQKLSGANILNIMGPLTGILDNGGILHLNNLGGDISRFASLIYDNLSSAAQGAIQMLVFWLAAQFIAPIIPTDVSTSPWMLILKPIVGIVGGVAANLALAPLLGLFLSFAAALALVYQMLKLFFRLIMAWLTIIFLTISAPFQFLFASLPGRQGIATSWILQMLGNILIFPAVIAVIYFVAFLLGPQKFSENCPKDNSNPNQCLIKISAANQINNGSLISPVYATDGRDIVGSNAFPLFGGLDLSFMRILLAFGALMALPKIPDLIVSAVGKAGQAGQMIGQEIMAGTGFGQRYTQRQFGAGIETGQGVIKGSIGETTVDAYGNVVLSRQGILRRGVGSSIPSAAGGAKGGGKWIWKP
ncbi:hypothetical protein HY383_01905 [Candidatus Daviesbacteria bacterium]|nr:hypothetical protein [Candidatus Daviesbacteria bacterium]